MCQATGESAESELARLNSCAFVDSVLSLTGDALLFGAPTVLQWYDTISLSILIISHSLLQGRRGRWVLDRQSLPVVRSQQPRVCGPFPLRPHSCGTIDGRYILTGTSLLVCLFTDLDLTQTLFRHALGYSGPWNQDRCRARPIRSWAASCRYCQPLPVHY